MMFYCEDPHITFFRVSLQYRKRRPDKIIGRSESLHDASIIFQNRRRRLCRLIVAAHFLDITDAQLSFTIIQWMFYNS